jgi:ribosomal RNA-processing protein 7
MAPIPITIGDFTVLPISMPPVPSFPQKVTHHIYIRRNAPKIPAADDARMLFVTNVPADSTEAHFRALFVSLVGAGKFESITFDSDRKNSDFANALQPAQAAGLAAHSKKRKRGVDEATRSKQEEAAQLPEVWSRTLKRSGSTAMVRCVDGKSVDLILRAAAKVHKTKKFPVWGEGTGDHVAPLGSRWLMSHNRLSYPDKATLQASVDAFFTVFNRNEEEAAQLAKRLRSEPDEDGFVTVTRGGRNGPAGKDAAEEAKRKMLEREAKKKDELSNFYRFQGREKRKAEQEDFKRRFKEDQKKVAAMKAQRGKFVPDT